MEQCVRDLSGNKKYKEIYQMLVDFSIGFGITDYMVKDVDLHEKALIHARYGWLPCNFIPFTGTDIHEETHELIYDPYHRAFLTTNSEQPQIHPLMSLTDCTDDPFSYYETYDLDEDDADEYLDMAISQPMDEESITYYFIPLTLAMIARAYVRTNPTPKTLIPDREWTRYKSHRRKYDYGRKISNEWKRLQKKYPCHYILSEYCTPAVLIPYSYLDNEPDERLDSWVDTIDRIFSFHAGLSSPSGPCVKYCN